MLCCIQKGKAQHRTPQYFLGCSEIIEIPLVAVDLAKFFPPLPDTPNYDFIVNGICGPIFAITFTYYRVSCGGRSVQNVWGYIPRDEERHGKQLQPEGILYVMMALNVLLGLLQLYWFSIIF